MVSKRSFLSGMAGLFTAGVAAGGFSDTSTATPAVTADTTKHRNSTETTRASVHALHAAGTFADADSVLTASVDPSVVAATRLPSPWATTLRELLEQYDSLSLGKIRHVSGSLALTAAGVEGCAIATGRFD